MFLGEFQHSVDSKGRLVLPSKFRDRLGRGLIVTKGQERCLYVFPIGKWEEEVEQMNQLPRTDRRSRNYARSFFGSATDQQLDGQGRIQIPQPLREYSGISKDVVIVGVADRVEIWEVNSWEIVSGEADELFAGIEDALSEQGI